jgi:hypothetical protein
MKQDLQDSVNTRTEGDGALTVTSARPSHGLLSVSYRDSFTAVQRQDKRTREDMKRRVLTNATSAHPSHGPLLQVIGTA